MIIFRRLRYRNFLSTGNLFTEIDLNKNRTTLILGQNGSGKSTILDALTFALFGKAFRNINKPQLINSITRKDMVVEIEFSIGSHRYKIVRGIKPNIFEIWHNDKLLNQSSESKDHQEILEKHIIKVNYKSFCQVVVLGSATFQPFMSLPKGARREVIEDLLDLNIFTTMNSLLKVRVMLNAQKINETNTAKQVAEDKIELINKLIAQVKSNTDAIIEDKKKRIEDTKIEIEKIEFMSSAMAEKLSSYVTLNVKESKIRKKLSDLDAIRHKIEANVANIQKELDFLVKNDNCPTCKQIITEEFKKENSEIKSKDIDEQRNGLNLLAEQYEKAREELQSILNLTKEYNELSLDYNQAKTKLRSLLEYINETQADIDNIKVDSDKSVDTNTDELKQKLVDLDKELTDLTLDKNVLAAAGTLLKDSGIKAKIIKQYVPIINKFINKYLAALDFFVQFELNEEFQETIKSRYRDEFSQASFF